MLSFFQRSSWKLCVANISKSVCKIKYTFPHILCVRKKLILQLSLLATLSL